MSNEYLHRIAARLSERAHLFHLASLTHLAASQAIIANGQTDTYHSSASIHYSRESEKIDKKILEIIKQNPQLKIIPSQDFHRISALAKKKFADKDYSAITDITLDEVKSLLASR